ncbi:MAG: MFS transporter, partial [Anaerolineales bacterium]|nr:MFS transporter [Anaerolineales bacterium]
MSLHLPPALKHRRFLLLWFGLLISMTGSQMQLWALFWHISRLSDNPIAVSAVGAARFFPILIFSLIGGLVADRYNRRKILFLTQTTSMLVALTLGLLTLIGQIQLWHIYLLTGVQATGMAFDLPARQALVPNLVPVKDLPSAFSLQSIASNTGAIVGPALSGLVIGHLGQEYTYLINAVTFLAVLAALLSMGPVAQQTSA